MITSLQNQRVKQAMKLRTSKQRRKLRQYAIAGAREILRAIASEINVIEVFVCQEFCESEESRQAAAAVENSQTELLPVSPEVFTKLAYGDRYDGLLAVAKITERALSDLTTDKISLLAVIENIEKPGNLGAILRSADGAGITGVIVTDPVTDLYNPNCIRASMGTLFSLPVCTATAEETYAWLIEKQIKIITTRPEASQLYTTADFTKPTAIVLGGEAFGLSDVWQGNEVTSVKLPMLGIADSLNVSNTAAIMFYEALRQRQVD